MTSGGWTFADLEADQIALVAEAERTLDDLVMAYAPSAWGTVDPETVGERLDLADLEPGQLEYLQGIEQKVGGVLVAYRVRLD